MKKFFLILTIASMVILDFILRGESITLGIFLLIGVAMVSKAIDMASQQRHENEDKRTVSAQEILKAV